MTERKWLPADYLDESVPELRASPSAWIVAWPGDVYALAPFDEFDDAPPEPKHVLKPGAIVKFCYHDQFPPVVIDIAADGRFTVVRGCIEPGANCVRAEGDSDTIDASVESLAGNWIGNGCDPGVVEIDQYYWSDGEDFRFEAGPEGPRFVPCRAVP